MKEKELAVILDGKKYRYITGECKDGFDCCDGCAFRIRCDDNSICRDFGKCEDSTGHFQLVEEHEEEYGRLIDEEIYDDLIRLGMVGASERKYNRGKSNYAKHIIQPWSIWMDWNLNPWDADIVKRALRTKEGEERMMDYEKIIHVCQERIRQLKLEKMRHSGKPHVTNDNGWNLCQN